MPRTDIHRPSEMVPADYHYVLSYSLASQHDRMPIPALGIDCVRERAIVWSLDNRNRGREMPTFAHRPDGACCVMALRESGAVFAETGGPGNCSVCGAHYLHGDVWRHVPTGEHIHVGHICAANYSLMADRSAYERARGNHRDAVVTAIRRNALMEQIVSFLDANPGLEAALKLGETRTDAPILADMWEKLHRYGSLSENQVRFARSIADRLRNPEPTVPAPEGRQTFRGRVISCKQRENQYTGETDWKMTVKMTTDAGSWLVYVTVPAALRDRVHTETFRGSDVELTATLTRSHDKPHFAFGKRPTGGRVLEPAAA